MMYSHAVWGIHIAAGFLALAVFWLSLRKRGPSSRRGRWAYVLAMAIVTLTSIGLLLSSGIVTTLYAIYLKAPVTSVDGILTAARATMKASENCFLITLDDSGQPQARVMQPFQPESDMTVWMGTNRTTRKVQQLHQNPRATLAYYDAAGAGYVTLIGKTRLVDDMNEKRKRWMKSWKSFFPEGPTGDSYILIEFTPTRIEVMSFTQGVATKPYSWRPAILSRQGSGWVLDNR